MKRVLVLFLIMIMGFSNLPAQLIDASYGTKNKDGLRNLHSLPDGGFILTGWINQYTSNHIGQGYIINIDNHGNKRWDRIFDTNSSNRITNILELSNDEFLFVIEEFPKEYDPGQVILAHLSSTGKILNHHNFGGDGPDIIEIMRSSNDGGFILVGEMATTINGDYQAWVAKLSSTFKIEWQHQLGQKGKDRLTDFVELENGNIATVGYQQKKHDDQYVDVPWLLLLSSSGDIITSKCPVFDGYGAIRGISKTSDGHLALGGYTRDLQTKIFDIWGGLASLSGDILWDQVIDLPGFNTIMEVKTLPDGSIVAIGSTKNEETSYDACIVTYDTTKKTIDAHSIRKDGIQFGRVINYTANDNIVIGGFNNQDDGQGDQLWLYKMKAADLK